jgi:hypothetical protein
MVLKLPKGKRRRRLQLKTASKRRAEKKPRKEIKYLRPCKSNGGLTE